MNSTVTGNGGAAGAYPYNDGGGVFNNYGTLTVQNSTIGGNTSFGGYGGGGILNFGTATIIASTIFENRADGPPGFQGRGDAIAGNTTVKNSVLASPTRGLGNACYAAAVTSLGYNIAGDASCAFSGTGDLNNTNPLLGSLANNGGPTQTHSPLSGSPAIDAVPVANCTDANGVAIATDQRGFVRPQGAACDIGSVELQAQPPEVFLNDRNNRDHQGPGSPLFDFSLASTMHLNEADQLQATYAADPEARTIASLQVGANYYVYVQDVEQHKTCALQYLGPGHYSAPVCVSVEGATSLVLHPDGTKLYVLGSLNTIVQVDIGAPDYTALTLNPNTLQMTKTGGGTVTAYNIDITPDGRRLLAVGGFHLYEVDTKDAATGLMKQTRDVPLPGSATESFFYPIRISPNPAKPFALIGDPDGDGVYKIDLGTLGLVRIAGPPGLGSGHTGTDKLYYTDMVFHESGNYAYAAFCGSTQCVVTGVGVIDVFGLSNAGTPTLTIQGGSPNMVAYAVQYNPNPAYHRLYVSYAYNLFGLRTFNVAADGSTVTFDTSYTGLPDFTLSLAVPQIPSTQPDLTITKTHTGNFTQGQSIANFLITVTNSGASPTVGTVTVTDDLSGAPGLTVVNFAGFTGTNWVCRGTTCTRNDPLAAGANYDPIELTVSVAGNAASPQVNHASVSGGGEVNIYNNTATDSVMVTQLPDLTIAKGHVGTGFTLGQQGAQYKLTVSNGGSAATTGSITVTDTLPGGLTFVSGSGGGFSCSASGQLVTCSNNSTPIPAGGMAAIALNVNVSATAAASLTNSAAVACSCAEISIANNTSNSDTVNVNFQVTVSTNINGPTVSVDGGAPFTGSQTFTWNIGSSHSLATSTPQAAGVGKQYVWQTWSDTGAISHSVTAAANTTSYTANFKTQYMLTTAVSPSAAAGAISPASGFVDAGAVVLVNATANAGYTFTGFTGDLSGTTTPTDLIVNAPKTVTANFSNKQPVTLSTVPAGLLVSVDGAPAVAAAPLVVNLTPGPHTIAVAVTQAGTSGTQYVFLNWSDSGASSHTITVAGTPAAYTASFKTQYQLTMATSPADVGSVSPPSGGFYGVGQLVNVSATAPSGYAFSSWTGPVGLPSSSSNNFVPMNGPRLLIANFAAVPPTIFQTAPSGLLISVDGAPAQATPFTLQLLPGQHAVKLAATQAGPPGSQYVFVSWSDGGAASHTITVGSTQKIYTAAFKTQYQLTTVASPVAGGLVSPASGFYDSGAVVSLQATPSSGYSFGSWTGAVANSVQASTSITMGSAQTVTANFASVSGITLQTVPAGLLVSVDGGAPQAAPVTKNLTQGPHTIAVVVVQLSGTGRRYSFASWSDGGPFSHAINVGASAATYTANFTTQYQVTTKVLPSSGGSVSLNPVSPTADGYYDSGTLVKATATPAAGFTFSAWGGALFGAVNPQILPLIAPASVTANFTPPNPSMQTFITNKSTRTVFPGCFINCKVTTMTLVLSNTGAGDAMLVQVNSLVASVLNGTGNVAVTAPLIPYNAGTVTHGGSANVLVQVTITGTVTRFLLSIGGGMQNSVGTNLTFSGATAVIP